MKTLFWMPFFAFWGLWGKSEPPAESAPAAKPLVTNNAPAVANTASASATPPVAVPKADVDKSVREAVEKAVAAAVKEATERTAKALKDEKLASEKADKLRAEAREDAKAALARSDREAETAKAEQKENLKRIESRIFRLNHVSAEEVAEKFNAMWSGDFGANWKISKMAVAFPESNTIMVTAPRLILDHCEKSIAELDVEAPQVYIEARFVELSNTAFHKLGIDWSMLGGMKGTMNLSAGYQQRRMDGISEYNSSDGTYTMSSAAGEQNANLSHMNAAIGMSELSVILRALESSEDARTFSNPKIIVSSGKKATVDMTTKYPNVKISAKRTVNGDNISVDLDMQMSQIPGEDKLMFAKESFFSWGISLDVTPRISTNGLINVTIVPTISSQSDWVEAGTSSEDASSGTISARYPVLDVQRLVTEFSMSSETTAVIGGLSRTVETQVDNGIPWLRDIWWIGPKLFGSKQRIKEQKEIIVFVTVGLVDPRNVRKDAGLPKNAVLGRQYTNDIRREPGDRQHTRPEGMQSLDLRSLEEQYADPRRTNRQAQVSLDEYIPFSKDPNYQKESKR